MSLILDYEQPIKVEFFPVGSVSISDGIVTNFSLDNYVQTKQIPYLEGTFDFRVCGSITYTPIDNEHLIPILSGCGGVNIGINRYAYLWLSGIVSEQKGNVQYDLNKEYIWSWKHTAGNYSLLYSEDNGQTWNTDISINSNNTIPNNGVLKIGGGYSNKPNQYWRGYVDLNKTYLEINGQEWKYIPGLIDPSNLIIDDGINQTEANYLIVNNKLVWANPKIYLQNNSNWNAYINTGIVPTNDMRFDVTAQITDTSTTWDGALFGERNASNPAPTTFLLWHNTDKSGWGAFCYGQGWSANWNNLTPSIKGTKNRFKYDGTTLTINGQTPTTGNWISKSSFSTTYPIFLYGFNSSGSLEKRRFHGRIYNATFWSGNTKLAEFVPVPQGLVIGTYTTPSAGMWDIVNKQFYANAGSGTFTWGKDE